MKQVEFRTLQIEDYDMVINLWERTEGIGLSSADSKDNINRFLHRNPGFSLVALNENELVGAVLCGHDGRRGYLHHLAVKKEYRLKGIGRELVRNCLQRLKEAGIDKCHIFVFQHNKQSTFWIKNGWLKREDIYIMSSNTMA